MLSITCISSFELQCTLDTITYGFKDLGRIYRCRGRELIVTRENEEVTSVKRFRSDSATFADFEDDTDNALGSGSGSGDGARESFRSIKSLPTFEDIDTSLVMGFECWSETVHYIPNGLGSIFKNIKGLHITSSGIKKVTKENLQQFPHLIYLNFATNIIEYLTADLFEFNSEMRFVGFSQNRLVVIEPEVFNNLKHLNTIDLGGNTCIDKYAISTEIPDIKALIEKSCNYLLELRNEMKEKIENCEREKEIAREIGKCDGRKTISNEFSIFKLFFGFWLN